MFLVIALVLFVLDAFGVHFEHVGLQSLGLACLAAHFLIGSVLPAWPVISRSKSSDG